MIFSEIKDLIMVRDYIISYRSDSKVDTKIVNYLNTCLSAIDKRIIGILSSSEFKNHIGYPSDQLAEQKFNLNKLTDYAGKIR